MKLKLVRVPNIYFGTIQLKLKPNLKSQSLDPTGWSPDAEISITECDFLFPSLHMPDTNSNNQRVITIAFKLVRSCLRLELMLGVQNPDAKINARPIAMADQSWN